MLENPETNIKMDRWSPYDQQYTQLSGGSPHHPSVPPEDSLNNFGASNSNPLLMSSCQGLPLSTANADPTSTSVLSNSTFENIISQAIQSSKDDEFFDDTLYNGVCKENQTGGHNFLQAQGSATRAEAFLSDTTSGYPGQVPSQPCQPNVFKRGSFGVLPHESVVKNHAPPRFDRNNSDKYGTQPPSVSYNNGPYSDRDASNVYSSAPQSAQSTFSGDNASLSPVVNNVTSPSLSNFSSPGDFQNQYSSPKTNFGAYNSLQSPVPLSPSVAQSYPSSPFANVDPSHINSAPPCSPMSSGTYMNNMNAVSQRNGQNTQHSPSNTSANVCYNTSSMPFGPQSVLQKTPPDYHSEYVYTHDHNSSSSYNSVYPTMHPSQMSGGNNSRISPRTHSSHPNSMPHDGRMPYGHSNTMTPAPISSPTYGQNKVSHEGSFRPGPPSINPGQSMHPPRYPPLNTHQNNLHPNPMLPDHMGNNRHFNFSSDLVDGKNSIDLFNSLEESGIHNHDPGNSITPYLENDLQMIDGDVLTSGRQLRSSESDDPRQNCNVNMENYARTMVQCPPVSKEPQKETRPLGTLNYPYSSSELDSIRPGNFTFHSSGRRRGRRGRKRKADVNSGNIPRYQSFKNDRNIYSNGYPLQPSNMSEYGNVDCYSAFKKRLCDEKELPPVNYSLSRYRSELKMTENQKKNCSVILSKPARTSVSIEDELSFLGDLKFPEENEKDSPHTFMKTRNKDSEGFLQCYRNFLASRKTKPVSVEKSPDYDAQSKHVSKDSVSQDKNKRTLPKLILKMGRSNSEWRLEGGNPPVSDDESASDSSGDIITLSSHIKKENDAEEKSKRLKHSGRLNKGYERYSKHSANRKRTRSDKCNDLNESSHTNSETLPAGEIIIKPEIESSPECDVELSNSSKKKGRKSRHESKSESRKKARKSSHKAPDSSEEASFVPVAIKQEVIEEEEIAVEGSRRSLRSRRSDTASSQEAAPGPSIKSEKIDEKDHIEISSDDEIDLCDDSDSDPAWTPSVKTPKGVDHVKSHIQITPKKRGPRAGGRRISGNAGAASRQKKERPEMVRKRNTSQSSRKMGPALIDPNVKVKKEKEQFLIAKSDINKKNPFLWRVDKETNMLQRFEWYEQQGIILYRSTYTYAAWNEISFSNYVTAKVRIVSHSRIIYVVEYLGPELSEEIENPAPAFEAAVPATTNPLRENFEVFLQTLISQALDPNFLTEITNENDEYFLNNIKEIESVTEDRKKAIIKDFWSDDLIKSADTYPSVDVLDVPNSGDCEVCNQETGTHQLRFHGEAYDWITFGTVPLLLLPKTQFTVCGACSADISLYSHLHHQKYNFFLKCRAKMNEVKGTSDKMESHVLLEECLQDHTWVDTLFKELETMWTQCDELS